MKTMLKRSILATTVASLAAFAAPASHAMDSADVQLEQEVSSDLQALGIKVAHPEMLTLGHLAEIKAIADTQDEDKMARIEAVIDRAGRPADDLAGTGQLEQALVTDLAGLGIKVEHPEKLTLSQVAQLKAIFDSDNRAEDKTKQAERVLRG